MNNVKFSIVFPTRERINLLKELLDSIQKNTANLSEIEVLIAVDEDDIDTMSFLGHSDFSFIRIFPVKRSLNFSRDYYTYLAKHSIGQWIITINDDCQFVTKDWDVIAYEILKDKSRIIYGWIEDNIEGWRAKGHGNYCCFPLQGRKGFEALGFIFPERIPTWGADIHAKNLYDKVNRVVILPFTIKHFCHHNRTREQDNISKRISNNQVPFNVCPTYEEINKLVKAIMEEKENAS